MLYSVTKIKVLYKDFLNKFVAVKRDLTYVHSIFQIFENLKCPLHNDIYA